MQGDPNLVFVIALFCLGFVFLYTIYGGFGSVVATDKLQLGFAYLGILGVLILSLWSVVSGNYAMGTAARGGAFFIAVAIVIIVFTRRTEFADVVRENDQRVWRWVVLGITGILALGLVAVFGLSTWSLLSNPTSDQVQPLFGWAMDRKPVPVFGLSGDGIAMDGMGILAFIAVILLPLLYQFVDQSNWQRVRSAHSEGPEGLAVVRRGLFSYSLESPASWLLLLAFGAAVGLAFPGVGDNSAGPIVALPSILIGDYGLLEKLIGYMFVTGILGVALSTADSVMSAAMMTFVYDVRPRTRRILENEPRLSTERTRELISSGRYFAFWFFLALFLLLPLAGFLGLSPDIVIAILFTFYAAQLSFAPAVIGSLGSVKFGKPNATWVLISIIAGASLALGLGIVSIYYPFWTWWPIPACVAASTILYGVGLFAEKYKAIRE